MCVCVELCACFFFFSVQGQPNFGLFGAVLSEQLLPETIL